MTSDQSTKSLRFGDLLRRHRLAVGFSQEHLAQIARMSVTAIGALERGVRLAPYRETVDLLADALGLDDESRTEFESAASRARARGRRPAREGSARHNLPTPQTSFVGRERDLVRLRGLILRQRHTAVTIIGVGGVGKSRLAIEAAREIVDRFEDGVWLVQLAWIVDPDLVPNAIASVLGIQASGDRSVLDRVGQALRRRKLLLILDNCEHVLPAATAVVAALQDTCPGVVILATSREPLLLTNELPYHLGPLAIPPESIASIEEALSFEAVDLFNRRAAALGTGFFDMTDETAPTVVEIVRRLDGLPLAIELAAPKLCDFSLEELAQGLENRFGLLVDERPGELPRHQALWALIDWSYDMLSADERFVFESCTVFAGPFTIDAIVAVAARDAVRDSAVYDAFTSLVAKSLVSVSGRGERRYGMLETIREYARTQMRSAVRLEDLRRKHAGHYLNVARRVEETTDQSTRLKTLRKFFAERPNFDAALTWALGEGGDAVVGAKLCACLVPMLGFTDRHTRNWLLVALEGIAADEHPETFAALTIAVPQIFPYAADPKARRESMNAAIDIYRSRGNAFGLVTALCNTSALLRAAGDYPAATVAAGEAVELARTLPTPRRLAQALYHLGQSVTWDEPERAARFFREALDVYDDVDPNGMFSLTMSALAEVEYRLGRVAVARDLTKRAAELLEPAPDIYGVTRAVILGEYSAYSLTLGDIGPARKAAREALRIELEYGMEALTAFVIQHLALASALLGEVRRAALLLGYCIRVTKDVAHIGIDKDFRERALSIVHAQLSPNEVRDLLSDGSGWNEDRAAEEAFLV
jgi:predicted ATPase/DNA-binding XRE family transcriptional regulator